MTALDEIRAEVARRGSVCGSGALIASLDESDQADIRAAFEEGDGCDAIARWLAKARGIKTSGANLRYHLAGRCKCPR